MDKKLQQFIDLSPEELLEKFQEGTEGDFALLDRVLLETQWPKEKPNTISLVERVIKEAFAEDSQVDMACTVLFKLVKEGLIGQKAIKELLLKLSKIMGNEDYTYARFRAARVVFLLGMGESTAEMVPKNDFENAVDILREFSNRDDELGELAEDDITRLNQAP